MHSSLSVASLREFWASKTQIALMSFEICINCENGFLLRPVIHGATRSSRNDQKRITIPNGFEFEDVRWVNWDTLARYIVDDCGCIQIWPKVRKACLFTLHCYDYFWEWLNWLNPFLFWMKTIPVSTWTSHRFPLRNYPLVVVCKKLWKISIFIMGKYTISLASFHSFLYVYQRVNHPF